MILASIVSRVLIRSPATFDLAALSGFARAMPMHVADDLMIYGGAMLLLTPFVSLLHFFGKPHLFLKIWCGLSLILAVYQGVNTVAVYWLRVPLTYQWMQHADLFRSFTSQLVASRLIEPWSVGAVLMTGLTFVAARWLGMRLLRRATGMTLWVLSLVVLAMVVKAASYPWPPKLHRGPVENPLRILVRSVWISVADALPAPSAKADLSDYRPRATPPPVEPTTFKRPANVIVIVMESVGATALESIDPARIPAITLLRQRGTSFTNAYVPAPFSTRALYALVAGYYPRFSHAVETQLGGAYKGQTIASAFKANGYKTAFFMGGEFAFQSVDTFLENGSFDLLSDIESIGCAKKMRQSTLRWQNIDWVTDDCMMASQSAWDAANQATPRFSIMWSMNTHFPYVSPGPAGRSSRARYTDAIIAFDRLIGTLLSRLAAQNTLDDSIILLTGDHGEAFGEHGNTMHGGELFEEETRIPLIIAGRGIRAGQKDFRLASTIDIAPTLHQLAGFAGSGPWQGRSLVAPVDRKRIPLFALLRQPLIGYRQGDTKVFYNLVDASVTRFNLARDPKENAPERLTGADAEAAKQIMADWAAYQNDQPPGLGKE